ncbi:unnamed protein product, partial [Polarella glacialis]
SVSDVLADGAANNNTNNNDNDNNNNNAEGAARCSSPKAGGCQGLSSYGSFGISPGGTEPSALDADAEAMTSSQLGASVLSAVSALRGGGPGQGLGGALSAFGAPTEWWHDSIILGRLSALALRYFASKALRKPWKAWLRLVELGGQKRFDSFRTRQLLALRTWHWRTLAHGRRLRRKLPLVRAIARLPQVALAPAFAKMRQ